MSRGLENDERYLLTGADAEDVTDAPVEEKKNKTEEYYELPPTIRSRSLIWSIISLVAGILSLVLCPFCYVALALALISVGGALIARRNFGFFDKYALAGLVFGIMGVVCGLFSMVAGLLGLFG